MVDRRNSNLFILLTLSRADNEKRMGIEREEIVQRSHILLACFYCLSIIIYQEKHTGQGLPCRHKEH